MAGAAPAVVVALGFHSQQQAIIVGAYGWNQCQLSLIISEFRFKFSPATN
jgi:hypothetical protein